MESLTEKESRYSLSQGFLSFPATGAISYPPTPPLPFLLGMLNSSPPFLPHPLPALKKLKEIVKISQRDYLIKSL